MRILVAGQPVLQSRLQPQQGSYPCLALCLCQTGLVRARSASSSTTTCRITVVVLQTLLAHCAAVRRCKRSVSPFLGVVAPVDQRNPYISVHSTTPAGIAEPEGHCRYQTGALRFAAVRSKPMSPEQFVNDLAQCCSVHHNFVATSCSR